VPSQSEKPETERACLGLRGAYDGARAYRLAHRALAQAADRNGPEPSRDGNLGGLKKCFAKLTEEGGALAFPAVACGPCENIREMYKGDVVTGRQRFATAMKDAWRNKSIRLVTCVLMSTSESKHRLTPRLVSFRAHTAIV
jgi:hypothetical protein